MSIDVNGISLLCDNDVYKSAFDAPSIRIILRPGQTELPFPLNVVDVNVDVSWNGLTSMKNFPKVIRGGVFNANYNLITSLDNLPEIDMPKIKPVCGWPAISLSFNNFSGPDKITAVTDMTRASLEANKNDNDYYHMLDAEIYMPAVDFNNVENFTASANIYRSPYRQQLQPYARINLAGNRALNKYDIDRNRSERRNQQSDVNDKVFTSKTLRKKYIADKAKNQKR